MKPLKEKFLKYFNSANRVGRPYLANIDRDYVNLPGTTSYILEAVNLYNMAIPGDRQYQHQNDISSRIDGFTCHPSYSI